MFCIPLRQEHRLPAPKNINRKKYQVIIPPPLSKPTPPSLTECCDEYLYVFVCERLPEWQKVCAQSALCICETIRPPFFSGWNCNYFDKQSLYSAGVLLTSCKISEEVVHYRGKSIIIQTLAKLMSCLKIINVFLCLGSLSEKNKNNYRCFNCYNI